MTTTDLVINPDLDLVLDRTVPVPPALVWRAWTTPAHLLHWFTPAPWRTIDCRIDLRPGGEFFTVMQSPEGQQFPNTGCYLEVVPERRLIWTDALLPGYRPAAGVGPSVPFRFTAALLLEPAGTGTRYRAIAMHSDTDARTKHEAMGFQHGWSAVLDQLVTYMQGR